LVLINSSGEEVVASPIETHHEKSDWPVTRCNLIRTSSASTSSP
jgi:hypothetical protein